ncbi:hypothetical protein A6R68_01397, partial [Neotoma lepida]
PRPAAQPPGLGPPAAARAPSLPSLPAGGALRSPSALRRCAHPLPAERCSLGPQSVTCSARRARAGTDRQTDTPASQQAGAPGPQVRSHGLAFAVQMHTLAKSSPGLGGSLVPVHVGVSARAHLRMRTRVSRGPAGGLPLLRWWRPLRRLARLRERLMKDFIECEDREQRQKAEGGGCSLCSRGGMRKC